MNESKKENAGAKRKDEREIRNIKKQIAEFVDYDMFIEMNMEDTGHKKINGKWVYVG